MVSASFRNVLITTVLASGVFAACGDDTGSGGTGAGTNVGAEGTGATAPTGGNGAGASGGGGSGAGTSDGGAGGNGGEPATGGGGATTGGGGEGGAFLCPEMELPVITVLPSDLSDTGLYEDILTDTVADYVRPYEPKYQLWSDDADKRRWAYIPFECGEQIDTSDMDSWEVPVGSRFWKEFERDGTRVETRIIVRTPTQFRFGAYIWNQAQTEAVLTNSGEMDVLGTGHDVPPQALCSSCHKSDWRILGFSAIQLTHALPGETMASLSAEGVLTVPDADGSLIPGDAISQPALGVLHANCGNCHYDGGVPTTNLKLRALVAHTTVMDTDVWTTAVGVPDNNPHCLVPNCQFIEKGDSANSLIPIRMGLRGKSGQMPPNATEDVDTVGLGIVTTWINSLPP